MTSFVRRLGRRISWLPVLLCGAVLALCYGGLLVPGQVLAARDIPFLHLPLRSTFRALLAWGHLPGWNPFIHGGQPVLSNPHYAAFYPATWLLLWLPSAAAIHCSIVLHAVLAFAGAWRLAARWNCGRAGRALAAIGFAGCGTFVSLPGTLLLFTGLAWLPWALLFGEGALAAPPSGRTRAVVKLAAVLGLQVLNGDPATVLVTWLALAAMAVMPAPPAPGGEQPAAPARATALRRLASAVMLALALAAVQAIPTWVRLGDSARGGGLPAAEAASWSTRPARLVEVFLPRLFGDPSRDEEDLYFGAHLNDKQYPFLQSLYPGLLLAILGLGALLRPPPGGIARRGALALAAVLGLFFGLGRFNPLFGLLRVALPFLGMLRYPEKFLLLTVTSLTLAGALSFDRLLATRRQRNERNPPDGNAGRGAASAGGALPVAAAVLIASLVLALLAHAGSGNVSEYVRRFAISPPSPAALAHGVAFLRAESRLALALALACFGVVVLLRRSHPSAGGRPGAGGRPLTERTLAALAVALLLGDLAYYDRGLNPTAPAADLLTPRALARQIAGGPQSNDRIFSDALLHPDAGVGLRVDPPGMQQLRARLDQLEPYAASMSAAPPAAAGALSYALNRDFDLMLTAWGRHALASLRGEAAADRPAPPIPEAQLRNLLAAWNVGTVVRRRPPQEQLREYLATRERPAPALAEPQPVVLPRWRLTGAVEFYPDAPRALAAARAADFDVASRELLIGDAPPQPWDLDSSAQVLTVEDHGDRVRLTIRAAKPALLVAAMTFDDGWSARGGAGGLGGYGAVLPTWPTALGQLATLVPAGSSTVSLTYRDPWVSVGAAVSLVAALACALAWSRSRRDEEPAAGL